MSPADTAITGHPVARGGALASPARLFNPRFSSLVNLLVVGGSAQDRLSVALESHERGWLRRGPFVAARATRDAEVLRTGLIEALHIRARRFQEDVFTAAEGGTLFLDDIERLPMELQRLLLEFLRRGRSTSECEDGWAGRITCGTGSDLRPLVADGVFIADLLDTLDKLRVELLPAH